MPYARSTSASCIHCIRHLRSYDLVRRFVGLPDFLHHTLPPLLPRHVHCWVSTLASHLTHRESLAAGSHTTTMRWRSIMCIPALVVCLAGAKTHQVSTSAALTAFLRLSSSCGGAYFPDATRDHPINGLYLIFSHKSRHIYFGETTTSNRVFQHWHAALGQPSQRVHYAMRRQGPSNFHCITVNLPDGIDRKALEVALIRKFDGFGKYLLNEKSRPTRRPDGKARATEIAVSRFFDPPPTQRFHQTHFHRPYRRVGYSPTLSIAPCRIPTVILYPNGFGGALEGLRLTGCYDIRLIVAFSFGDGCFPAEPLQDSRFCTRCVALPSGAPYTETRDLLASETMDGTPCTRHRPTGNKL